MKTAPLAWACSVISCLVTGDGAAAVPAEIYVAVSGNDSNLGTKDKPFRTLERARDAIRKLKQSDPSATGYTVWLRGGVHYRAEAFELSAEDSGSEKARVSYRAFREEYVRLSGAKSIPPDGFQPVEDPGVRIRLEEGVRGKVLQIDLKAWGINDYGPAGLGGLELFCNDQRMQLARWPNQGWALARRDEKDALTCTFTFPIDPPNAWAGVDDVFLHGYWRYDYQDAIMKPKRIDTDRRTISLESKLGEGSPGDRRFYALNVFEELDRPGEWYLNRAEGVLYFVPPEVFAEEGVSLSVLTKPLVVMRNTEHVTLPGLTFEATRSTAVVIEGGETTSLRTISSSNVSIR